MKNQSMALLLEGSATNKASNAIQQINSLIDQRYPVLSSFGKSRLLVECLIELQEEKKFKRREQFLP